MRILHYLEYLDTTFGGPVRATLDLTGALAARGHQVVYITRDDRDAPAEFRGKLQEAAPGKVTIVRLPAGGGVLGRFSPQQFAVVREALKMSDVAHVHGVWKTDLLQLTDAARSLKKPYFVSLRGMLDDWSMEQKSLRKRLFLALGGRRQLENAAAVHCTAQAELDQARKWFPRGQGVVIANLLDLNPYRNAPGTELAKQKFPALNGSNPRVLFLSRIHYKKGVEVLIRAAANLKRRSIDCTFVIAGTGDADYIAKLQSLVAELGVDDRVEFVGHVGGALKVSLYQACDIFAIPTSQENFGFVFPEALACGLPVITTKGVDIWPELLESGASSIVDGTDEAFSNEIAKLIEHTELRQEMASKGRPFVMRAFDEKYLAECYERMYQAV